MGLPERLRGPREVSRAAPLRLAAFFGGANLIGGVHLPFFPAWLEASGQSATDIGLIIALMGMSRVVAGPLLSFAADSYGMRKRAVITLVSIAIVSYAGYTLTGGFTAILFWSIIGSLAWSAITPIIEGLTLQKSRAEGFEYGRVRLWGSAAFIVANIASGWLVGWLSLSVFLPLLILTGSLTLLAAIGLPPDPKGPRPARSERRGHALVARALIRHPVFILFVFCAASVQGTHGFYYGFATLDWKAQGFSDGLIGSLWALGVVAEIVLFFVAGNAIRRINPVWLLAVGAASGILRWTIAAFQPALFVLVPLQVLHAGTFGAAHLGAMNFLLRAAPERLVSTAQAVYAAVTVGVVMAAAQYASGFLFKSVGSWGYLAMAALAAVALALSLVLLRAWNGHALLASVTENGQGDRQ